MLNKARPTVSVIIKALNEEDHIASAIESALAGTAGMNAEIILADSLSTDRTIEIAKQYPIRIASLSRPQDRSCGVVPWNVNAACFIPGLLRRRVDPRLWIESRMVQSEQAATPEWVAAS